MRWIADLAYLFVGLLYLPVALYNAVVVGKNRTGWGERFGGVRRRPAGGRRVWVHAVSLGEINATPSLIAGLREAMPDVEVVVSTTTDTGHARAVQLYGAENVFRFPLDFSLVIDRVLDRIRPVGIVLVELEVWYNLVRAARRQGIPVVVVNGRLTERSARRFARLGGLVRPMFSELAWVGAQDEGIAARFRRLGTPAERVAVISSLKWDTASVVEIVPGMDELAAALGIERDRPMLVCGSTGPGEEQIILEAWRAVSRQAAAAPPLLAIVPRKPERFDEVAGLIAQAGFACVRRSEHRDGGRREALPSDAVVLGDTMGEMRKFYGLSRVAFVGRSLVPMGGSDPIEAAALGRPVLAGPHMDNFLVPARALTAAGAMRTVRTAADLATEAGRLLADAAEAMQMGQAARRVVLEHQGATKRTVEKLVDLIRNS